MGYNWALNYTPLYMPAEPRDEVEKKPSDQALRLSLSVTEGASPDYGSLPFEEASAGHGSTPFEDAPEEDDFIFPEEIPEADDLIFFDDMSPDCGPTSFEGNGFIPPEEIPEGDCSIPFNELSTSTRGVRAYQRRFVFGQEGKYLSADRYPIVLQIQREELPCTGPSTGIIFGQNQYGVRYEAFITGDALEELTDQFPGIETFVIQCDGLANIHPFTGSSQWEDLTSISLSTQLHDGSTNEVEISALNAEALYKLLTGITKYIRDTMYSGSIGNITRSAAQRLSYYRDLEAFCVAMAQVALDKVVGPCILARENSTFGLPGEDTYTPDKDGPFVAYTENGAPLDASYYRRSLLRYVPQPEEENGKPINYGEMFPFFVQIERGVEHQVGGTIAVCNYDVEIRDPLLPHSHHNLLLREKIQISCKVSSSASRVQPPVDQSSWRDGVTVMFRAETDSGQNPLHLARTLPIPKEKLLWYEIKLIKGDHFTHEPITSDNSHLLLHIAEQLVIEMERIREHEDHKLGSKIQNPQLLQRHLDAEKRLEVYVQDLQRLIEVLKTIDRELAEKHSLEK